jgi:hypothetical protein
VLSRALPRGKPGSYTDGEYIVGEHELSIQRVERQRERGKEEAIVAVSADERRAEKSQRRRPFLWDDVEPPRT